MLAATPDGRTARTTDTRRALLFTAARRIAAVLDDDFTGSLEIHLHKGHVGVVKLVQSFRGGES
jgi:hypothetical protein